MWWVVLHLRSGSAPDGVQGLRTWRRVVFGYLLLVFAITLAPIPPAATVKLSLTGFDKLVHALVIAGLALLLLWRPGAASRLRSAGAALLVAAVVAGLIELLQEPVPYRSGDVRDFIAGVLGAVSAVVISFVLQIAAARRRARGRS